VIVLDASVALEMILATEDGARAAAKLRELGEPLHAPHLIDLEVLQVLRRVQGSGTISSARARAAIGAFGSLAIRRHEHALLRDRIWNIRKNLTAYDGAYVALAEALDAPLFTLDARLARSKGHRARVELI
jgi:predicted nucleic acid-binding protein